MSSNLRPMTTAFVRAVGEMMLTVENELHRLVVVAREEERELCAKALQDAGHASAAALVRSLLVVRI